MTEQWKERTKALIQMLEEQVKTGKATPETRSAMARELVDSVRAEFSTKVDEDRGLAISNYNEERRAIEAMVVVFPPEVFYDYTSGKREMFHVDNPPIKLTKEQVNEVIREMGMGDVMFSQGAYEVLGKFRAEEEEPFVTKELEVLNFKSPASGTNHIMIKRTKTFWVKPGEPPSPNNSTAITLHCDVELKEIEPGHFRIKMGS